MENRTRDIFSTPFLYFFFFSFLCLDDCDEVSFFFFCFKSRDWLCVATLFAQSGGDRFISASNQRITGLPGISEEINDEQNSAILATGQIKAFSACWSYVLCKYSARAACSLGNLKTLKHKKKKKRNGIQSPSSFRQVSFSNRICLILIKSEWHQCQSYNFRVIILSSNFERPSARIRVFKWLSIKAEKRIKAEFEFVMQKKKGGERAVKLWNFNWQLKTWKLSSWMEIN